MKSHLQRFGVLGVVAVLLAGCGGGASATPASVLPSAFDLSKVEASVAYIQTQGTFVTADGTKEQIYSGSGFVVDPSGLIVTNNHVVTGGAFWKVSVGSDKTLLTAQVVGVSECSDLAVLKVSGKYPALVMASANPTVGETIYVAGHPNGDPYTLTNGIVAKPAAPSDTSWASVENEIQITAQTYPGNSGSPVIDAAGRVVGVQYAGGIPGSPIAGESFAIAATDAKTVVDQIIKTNSNLDYIGINGEASTDGTGIAIISVAPGSPADKAGIQAGDSMTNLNGTAVGADGTKATYCSVLRSHKTDATLSVIVTRGGQTLSGEINGRPLVATGGTPSTPSSTIPPSSDATSIDLLQPFIPSAIWSSCSHSTATAGPNVVQSAICLHAGVDGVWYDLYDNAANLKAAYDFDAQAAKAKPATAKLTCANGNANGTWTYNTAANLPDQGLLCYTFKDSSSGKTYAVIEQSDPAANVMFTVMLDGSQAALLAWWKANTTVVEP